ncbi:MAG: lipoprotein signal peptidase [Chitinophagaceae bacterium]
MKKTQVFLLAFLILLVDQVLKIYIKTNYYMGQETVLFESLPWFRLHFVENEGMAYGWKLGGSWGKIALTTFRLVAVIVGTFYLLSIIKKQFHKGYIICVTFIYAGAIGNLIDSLFYGMVFEFSDVYAQNLAKGFWEEGFKVGYEGFLHGRVVDMLYFPIIENGRFPEWFPIWGGESFEFFRPVFNIADTAISGGVFTLILFQNRFFPEVKEKKEETPTVHDTLS